MPNVNAGHPHYHILSPRSGMSQILHVNANLVLTTRFQFQFHKLSSSITSATRGNASQHFASIVGWRRIRKIRLIVLQPALYGATSCSSSRKQVPNNDDQSQYRASCVPKFFSLHGFGFNQQARSIAVQTVNNVHRTTLMRTMKIIIKHLLYAK